jgi:hypothetical protein
MYLYDMEKQTKTLRFSRDLIKKAEAIAKREKRSFNNWLERLIEDEVNSDFTPEEIAEFDKIMADNDEEYTWEEVEQHIREKARANGVLSKG